MTACNVKGTQALVPIPNDEDRLTSDLKTTVAARLKNSFGAAQIDLVSRSSSPKCAGLRYHVAGKEGCARVSPLKSL